MAAINARGHGGAPIPVTVISGFRGAGKSTFLKYVLENSTTNVACVVHDLASFSIDARRVRRSKSRVSKVVALSALCDIVELQNGCACYSAADELFPAFAELLAMANKKGVRYDRFILENPGAAEPENIRDSFNEAVAMSHSVTRRIRLDSFITVVDASTFIHNFASKLPMAMRPDLGEGAASLRPVVDLLVEQVECSDIVILNKADTMDRQKLEALKPVLASLNTRARIVSTSFGKIPLELLNKTGEAAELNNETQHRTAMMAAKADAKFHDQDIKEAVHYEYDHGPTHLPNIGKKFGITSFVYSRRKPFHPTRLRELIIRWLPATKNMALEGTQPGVADRPIKRVLRSKGFCWLANNHLSAFYWSHAGQHFELREEGPWWATVLPDRFPPDPRQKKIIYKDFDLAGRCGDRRQEIVFIGSVIDEEEITKQMDAALLTEDEMEQYLQDWSGQPDPQHPDVLYFQELPDTWSYDSRPVNE